MTKKMRIGIVISIIWFIVGMLFAIGNANSYRGFKIAEFLMYLIVFNILPLTFGWGIWWIRKE